MNKCPEYCVFYHDVNYHTYYVYYAHLDKYEVTNEIPNHCDNFEHSRLTKISINEKLNEGKEMKDILKDNSDKLLIWRNELKAAKTFRSNSYDFFLESYKENGKKFCNTNESNIMAFFNKYSTKKPEYMGKNFDKITWEEYKWYELENNSSLMRCEPGTYNCLGYDFKMAYPTYLSSQVVLKNKQRHFHFPIHEGIEMTLKELPKNLDLKYGLYKVKISTENEDFKFAFNFNKDNVIILQIQIDKLETCGSCFKNTIKTQ